MNDNKWITRVEMLAIAIFTFVYPAVLYFFVGVPLNIFPTALVFGFVMLAGNLQSRRTSSMVQSKRAELTFPLLLRPTMISLPIRDRPI